MVRGGTFLVGCVCALVAVESASAQSCTTNADCNDGIFCTKDICAFNSCTHGHDNGQCNDGLFCTGVEFCNTVTDACASGTPPSCAPGFFCSLILDGCVECDNNAQCSDLVFCNGVEVCNSGLCQDGTPPSCPGDECTPGFCNAQTDQCDVVDPPCNDNSLCTDDICVEGVGCNNPSNFPNGFCCNPGNGNLIQIDDSNPCTLDSCNAQNGQVTHTPAPCSDNNACTINDQCVGGNTCVGTNVSTISCTKDSDCPKGVCSSVTGTCKCTPCSSAAQCNDSVACTTDTCNTTAGTCVNTANDGSCSAALFCNQQFCNRETGCVARPFCTPTAGNPCLLSADCNESTDLCGGCPAPTATVGGPRYINITPAASGGSTNVALIVKGDCQEAGVSCTSKYVDFDSPVNPSDPFAGRLVATSVFRSRSSWGTVKVRGTELVPGKRYRVYTECDFGGGNRKTSAGVALSLWKWTDNNNDGLSNFSDISREVTGFSGVFSGSLTLENTDLRGTGSDCKPDRTVSFVDISAAVSGFQSQPFPCANPCP